jgi:signal transduction histidine kinase
MGESVPLAGSYSEYALLHREPILLTDIEKAERKFFPSLLARCKRCSVMGLPLHFDGQAIGTLWLIAQEPNPFVESDVARARIFADLGVLAFQRIRLYEQLEQRRADLAQVMASRSRLMRGFSHDVKNPLGAADGYAALLLDGAYGTMQDSQVHSVTRIRKSLQNALGLIEDLHKIARAEVEELEIRHDRVALRELLAGIVDEYRAGAEQRHLHLSLELDGAPETITTDGRRVRQILGNLLSNAIKFTDRGKVRVALSVAQAGPSRQPGKWITIAITDTGAGIPSDKLGLLFQEFSRVGPADKPGAGLGLAISERLAEALCGRITVTSSEGHGSTFTLWLPVPP